MLKTRVIPTLLISEFGLFKGESFDSWRRVGVPMQGVKVYNARDVDELVLLDIGATPEERDPDYDLIRSLAAECFVPLAVGGGVRDLEMVRKLLAVGADKVCINSAAFESPSLISEAANRFGSQCVVVSMDVRLRKDNHYECYYHCGRTASGKSPVEWAHEVEKQGAGEILLTSIERDGTMSGYDIKLIEVVAKEVKIPVIASGGAGSYSDMVEAVKKAGASAVAASSMFLFTHNTPKEARAFLADRGISVRGQQAGRGALG